MKTMVNNHSLEANTSELNPQFNLQRLNKSVFDKHVNELTRNTAGFPVDALPEDVQEIIKQTNECLNFPIDFIASSLIHAAGTAIGNTCRARFKWDEGANLNMVLVGNPGTIKSHPPDFAYSPLYERDNQYYLTFREELQSYEAVIATYSKKDGGELPQKPILKKHIVSDCTIEALVAVLSNNKRGVCSYNDELAGWLNNMNRYNNGSDLQQWLSIWSSKPIVVDRKSSGSIRINKPFVAVIGTIQPSVIDEMGRDNKSKNGFTDRILFVWPKGLKRQGWTTNELDNRVKQRWFSIINKLLSIDFAINEGIEEANYLPFTPEAETILREWQELNVSIDEEQSSEVIDSISAKIEIYVIRFSLIIQLMRWACGDAGKTYIDAESVKAALAIAKYFKRTAIEVSDYMNSRTPIDRLPEIKKKVYKGLPKQFTTEQAKVKWQEVNNEFEEKLRLTIRTLENWLNDTSLFTWIKQGNYHKNY